LYILLALLRSYCYWAQVVEWQVVNAASNNTQHTTQNNTQHRTQDTGRSPGWQLATATATGNGRKDKHKHQVPKLSTKQGDRRPETGSDSGLQAASAASCKCCKLQAVSCKLLCYVLCVMCYVLSCCVLRAV
jgi:hypothetical protein